LNAFCPLRIVLCCSDDAARHAGRLHTALVERFGAECVEFLEPRVEREALARTIDACDVLIAVLGRRALDGPGDRDALVRVAVERALHSDRRVLPVLVQDATMPSGEELPPKFRRLASRQVLTLTDERWAHGVKTLIDSLEVLVTADADQMTAAIPDDIGGDEVVEDGALTAPPLASMLERAARRGIVPAAAAIGTTAAPTASTASPPPPVALPPGEPIPPSASWPEDKRLEPRGGLGGRSLFAGLVFALAAVGGLVVTARWLLGWFVEPLGSPDPAESDAYDVQCTVFAPPSVAPGDSFLVQAFVHMPEDADVAGAIATELDVAARRRAFRSLECPVRLSSRIQFELRMPGLEIDEPVAALVWRRRTESVQFGVRVPPGAPTGTVIGTLAVSVDSAPSGYVKFKLAIETGVTQGSSEPQGERARRYTAAFISYASTDRDQALEAAQLLRGVGIRYFQDVLDLEPGDRWLKRIELGIDECDLFLLCWSSAAKRSEWVRKEVQYALARQTGDELGLPDIQPLLLEGPPPVLPWEELEHLHFNDPLLYFRSRPRGASTRACSACGHENSVDSQFCSGCGRFLDY
jgi:hypothetical protein